MNYLNLFRNTTHVVLLGFCFSVTGLLALGNDHPVFYRSPLMLHEPKRTITPWTTAVSVRYVEGSTKRSRDIHGDKRPLYSIFGDLDLVQLGIGVENPGNLTRQWRQQAAGDNLFTLAGEEGRPEDNGKVSIDGRLKASEIDVTVEQSLFSGFFVQAYFPIRRVRVNNIKFNRLGSNMLESSVMGRNVSFVDATPMNVNIDEFINNVLPGVLDENGFHVPNINTLPNSFRRDRMPELALSAGWQVASTECLNFVSGIRGRIQATVLVPLSVNKDEDDLFAFPLGYNNHVGFSLHLNGALTVWKFLVVGAAAGGSCFLKEDRNMRMQSDKAQQGWFRLAKGFGSIDPGSLWYLGAYGKAERVLGGFSCLFGYSYTKRERTILHVKDDVFLRTVIRNGRNAAPQPKFISKDDIVNDDDRLRGWDQHTLYFGASYDVKDLSDSVFAPKLSFEYDYTFAGKQIFTTDMIGGSIQFSMQWDF